jgi:hypothetical protein
MKNLKFITMIILVAAFVTLSMTSRADDQKHLRSLRHHRQRDAV